MLASVDEAELDLEVHEERWGDDPRLVELLGDRGAEGFRAVLDEFPELVGVLWAIRDAEGRIVDFSFGYGNPAILRAFRLPAATRDRYTLLEALPQMRDSRAFHAYTRVVDLGEPWVQEITYDTPLGDGYMLGTFVERTMKLGDGLVTFLTDVTEQRRMEAELRTYAEVVAHDLREPIMAMALLVTLLERQASEPPSPELLENLRASNARARELIDCVLAYAQAGVLRTEPVALGQIVSEVEQDLRPRLDEEQATIEVGDLPDVEGDPRQLRRVLQNLVANALKFRSEALPRVEISAQRGSREWIVGVRDNGIGVAPDQAGRIFGLFSRGSTAVEGVGIGLAMCRRIVEAHGGRIWVEPAEGGGSTFRFTLPHARPG
jgi:signal transduction histidine kinase